MVPEHAGPDAIVDVIAAVQRRVVTFAQLTAAGLTRSAIAHRVAVGRLHRIRRGVFLVGHPDPLALALETAALLACGRRAALGRQTGAALWGVPNRESRAIHVIVAARQPVPWGGVVVHLTSDLDPRDVRWLERLPVTSPARTLLDLAGTESERDLRWAVEELRLRRHVTLDEIAGQLERTPRRRGARALRRIIDAAAASPAHTRSEAERRLLDLVSAARLPVPRTNVRVHEFEVDAVWHDQRLVVEVDGFAFHGSRSAFERDRRRDAVLQSHGWRVVRVTWRQLCDEPEALVALLARLLERGAVGGVIAGA